MGIKITQSKSFFFFAIFYNLRISRKLVKNMEKKVKFQDWPIWDAEEEKAIMDVLRSGKWWAGAPKNHAGEQTWKFQEEFAQFNNSKYCFACTNGTHAIEIVLMAMGIGLGDEVIVSSWTFVASASAVIAANAVPIFCDVDPDTFLIDPNKIENLIVVLLVQFAKRCGVLARLFQNGVFLPYFIIGKQCSGIYIRNAVQLV